MTTQPELKPLPAQADNARLLEEEKIKEIKAQDYVILWGVMTPVKKPKESQ
jgi:hypothetical protein